MKDGFILINKPAGFTSFDVIAKLRGILNEKKLGHAGTLDPNATGVLPIFIGRATKAINILERQDKSYIATFRLGIQTDTQDIWGKILEEHEPVRDISLIEEAVKSMSGEIMQLPPMYSAIKINGRRLYDLAREGLDIERQSRRVNISSIEFSGEQGQDEYGFSVSCSKGTYVRTLCADIGEKLGCGATMTSLVRTSALGLKLENCVTMEEVQKAADEGRADELVHSVEQLFSDFPPIYLSAEQTRFYVNGVALDPERVTGVIYSRGYEVAPWQKYSVYGQDGKFIGVGSVNYPEREFKSIKMF